MENKSLFKVGVGEYKVPINPEIYRTNLEYYSGMGIYTDEICMEKAFLTSGYRVIKPHEFNNEY